MDPRVVETLLLFAWPHNVRQLLLLTRALIALHGRETRLEASHLAALLGPLEAGRVSESGTRLAAPDSERVVRELERCQGNVRAAAAALGISRQRVYRLLRSERSR